MSAETTSAPRQPNAAAKPGPSSPDMATPTGTPVCLIEKSSGCCRGGTTRARRCEEAGVETVLPSPTGMAPSATSATPEGAARARPKAAIASATWETRSAP
jgi:hypothetical protein